MPSLFVIRGNDRGTRFELEGESADIGRDSCNAVQLHDNEVSRRHAQIRRQGDAWTIVDLSSSNGTFVNGRRVLEYRLATGDHIQVGGTLMLYTQPLEEIDRELVRKVSIAAAGDVADQSHIIRSISQEEGSRLLETVVAEGEPEWLARARRNLQVMYRTALAVGRTADIDQLLQRILDLIFEWVEADRGCIMLLQARTGQLEPKVRRTRTGRREELVISKTILDYVLARNEGVLTSDARQDQRWDAAASILQAGTREAICVPMQGRYDRVGVIYIDTSTTPEETIRRGGAPKFTEDHLKLLVAIAHQAAIAVEDTRNYSALVQAERLAAVGQTVATLSHHIKNILQGIRGGSYLIEMGLAEHDEELVRKGWNIVERNQARISSLVMDMLTFSKVREPEPAVANINRVVEEVIDLMRSRAEELGVQLHWQPEEAIPELVFDPEAIHRAVLNVVTNALDAAAEQGESGRVEVHTFLSPDATKVGVVVDDNGPGIPADQVESLFDPFVSFKGGRGTGLGLPVSKKILAEHGGEITAENRPGHGARFVMEFPAVTAESASGTDV